MSVWGTLRASFAPLKIKNFRIYLGGQAISLIGTWLQSTAQAWVVWELTRSEASLGVVNMLNTLPILLLGPWAGVWADRMDRRKLLIATQVGAMILAFVLALLIQTGTVQLWHVYILGTLLGVVAALDMPAQQAFLGDLAGMSEVRKAVNLNAMILQVSRVLGPSLAGFVVARIGTAPAFWLNGLSFLAVIASLIMVRSMQRVQKSSRSGGPLRQLRDALAFLRTQPRMQDLFIFAAMMTFFGLAILFNLMPSVADKILNGDAQTLGALMGASGAGALVAVVLVVPLAQARKHSGIVLTIGSIWMASWMFVFSLSTSLPLSMACLFLSSMGAPTVLTMTLGLTQLMSPLEMRARLLSLFTMISFGMQPIAALLIGFSAEHFGVQAAIQINTTLLVISACLMFAFRPGLRDWEANALPPQGQSMPAQTH
jgi:MFS family permease